MEVDHFELVILKVACKPKTCGNHWSSVCPHRTIAYLHHPVLTLWGVDVV